MPPAGGYCCPPSSEGVAASTENAIPKLVAGLTVDVRIPTGEKFTFLFENDTDMTPLLAQLQDVIKRRARQRLQDWQTDL